MKNCNFKIKFSRTNKKSECISVKGPKMWNQCGMTCLLILNCVSRCLHLKKCIKLYFYNRINFVNAFVFNRM